MIYCTACSAPLSVMVSPLVFHLLFHLSERVVKFGQGNEKQLHCQEVYSDLLKALNAICFVPSL